MHKAIYQPNDEEGSFNTDNGIRRATICYTFDTSEERSH